MPDVIFEADAKFRGNLSSLERASLSCVLLFNLQRQQSEATEVNEHTFKVKAEGEIVSYFRVKRLY